MGTSVQSGGNSKECFTPLHIDDRKKPKTLRFRRSFAPCILNVGYNESECNNRHIPNVLIPVPSLTFNILGAALYVDLRRSSATYVDERAPRIPTYAEQPTRREARGVDTIWAFRRRAQAFVRGCGPSEGAEASLTSRFLRPHTLRRTPNRVLTGGSSGKCQTMSGSSVSSRDFSM